MESKGLAVVPNLFRILVKPKPPKRETDAGIALPNEVIDAERTHTCTAKVVAMGSLAYEATTKGGLDFSKDPGKPRVDDWIVCNEYAGQAIYIDGELHRILNDTDILGLAVDPSRIGNYVR